jgi:Cdc6-like AAA superfamily ATPase
MPKIIFVCGNDGFGKTTYVHKLVSEYRKKKSNALRKHYYSNPVRSFLRGFVTVNKVKTNKDSNNKVNKSIAPK